MKKNLLDIISCYECGERFIVINPEEKDGEIYAGTLECSKCKGACPWPS